jgi:hypothetical protein
MSSDHPRDVWEETLPAEEFERLVRQALADLDGSEGEEMRAHMRWFLRRYPTPLDRLRYSTRKYKEWSKTRGIARRPT